MPWTKKVCWETSLYHLFANQLRNDVPGFLLLINTSIKILLSRISYSGWSVNILCELMISSSHNPLLILSVIWSLQNLKFPRGYIRTLVSICSKTDSFYLCFSFSLISGLCQLLPRPVGLPWWPTRWTVLPTRWPHPHSEQGKAMEYRAWFQNPCFTPVNIVIIIRVIACCNTSLCILHGSSYTQFKIPFNV